MFGSLTLTNGTVLGYHVIRVQVVCREAERLARVFREVSGRWSRSSCQTCHLLWVQEVLHVAVFHSGTKVWRDAGSGNGIATRTRSQT